MADDYNYATFVMANEEPHFLAFPDQLHVGGRAPSHELEDLDGGEPLALSSLWSTDIAILEFGSFT